MERLQRNFWYQVDWITIGLYAALVLLGWINIYAAVYDPETDKSIWDTTINAGKQLRWLLLALLIILAIFLLDFKFYSGLSYIIYGLTMLSLVAVLVFGREVAGSKSWFDLGFARLQPAEFAKFATALAVARLLGDNPNKIHKFKVIALAILLLIIPVALIMMQGDTGSALVFAAFFIVFYREGFSQNLMAFGLFLIVLFVLTLLLQNNYLAYLLIGLVVLGAIVMMASPRKTKNIALIAAATVFSIAVVLSVNFFVSEVLKPHQQRRIKVLVNPDIDPKGIGWQVMQSKIAIGSGGFSGKGFLEGTQTKFDFVPDQSTDFIFCTVGEEHGWLGTFLVIALFVALMLRLIILAERQKTRFSQIYGYCVAVILFFHFAVNIGMTVGMFPVIGIPLPFFSYGGSSLWAFTILLFIMIKLDVHKRQLLVRY